VGIVEEPVNPGDPIVLRAIGVGTSAFSVASGNRTGQAQLTVLAGTALPVGTVRWKLPSLGPYGISRIIQSERVNDDTPVFYIQDDGVAGGNGAIRALREDGQQKWIWPANGAARYPLVLAGDNFGGTIYIASNDVPNQFQGWCYLGRVDQGGIETWQYQFSNCYEDYAIHADDGTIFLLEPVFQNTASTQVTALDPNTGQIKFTIPVPQLSSSSGQNYRYAAVGNYDYAPVCAPGSVIPTTTSPAEWGLLSIDSNGTVYLTLSSQSVLYDATGCDPGDDPQNNPRLLDTTLASWTATATLHLMKIRLDGSYTLQTLDSRTNSGTNWAGAGVPGFGGSPGRAIPDGQGGVLSAQGRALYRASASGVTKFTLPMDAATPFYNTPLLVGEDGTAYLVASSSSSSLNDRILAVDPASGTIRWSVSTKRANLNLVTTDGKVVFEYSQPDFTRHVAVADATGQVSPVLSIAGSPDPAIRGYTFSNPDYWDSGLWNVPMPGGGLVGIMGSVVAPAIPTTFAQAGGGPQRQTREPSGVTFEPDRDWQNAGAAGKECTGLDNSTNLDPTLMVPLQDSQNPQAANWFDLKVRKDRERVQLRYVDLNAGNNAVSVTPSHADTSNDRTRITVAGSSVGVGDIEAYDSVSQRVLARLTVTVKPSISWTVDLFGVREATSAVAPNNLPDPIQLEQYLNKVYGKQANLSFSVLPRQQIQPEQMLSIAYDSNGNGRLESEVTFPNSREATTILTAMINRGIVQPLNHKWMIYVRAIEPASTEGFAGRDGAAGFIQDQARNGQVHKTAHELGHTLGLPNSADSRLLMFESADGSRPCRIPRSHWKIINPTTLDDRNTP
jgi:hypothetical protein